MTVALVTRVSPLVAQRAPFIDLRPPVNGGALSVSVRDVLTETSFDELLRNGFPTSMHFVVEAWTVGRWFDVEVGRVEWDVIVRYDLVDRSYYVDRRTLGAITPLGNYSRFADAKAASELSFQPSIASPAVGKDGYFSVRVDVQTLDISDLAEMQRWLRGEARPAVRGRRNPGTALTRGVRTLMSRVLGGEVRHLETRSAVVRY